MEEIRQQTSRPSSGKESTRLLWMITGLIVGVVGSFLFLDRPRQAMAANDRYQDFVMCTGSINMLRGVPTEGVWMLDYRAGKLLGTVVDRNLGKIIGWAEVDLVNEFSLPPRQDVHFMMTAGQINESQSALYIAEVNSGKFGVYTMGVRPDRAPGLVIRRHDLVYFRQQPPQAKN